ncbi:hypothetical protein PR048_006252 [Dryococelus australis]|uniref:Integrase catalytic domain-containing protein n=1 Tax=Dryococelus australis TaxID=614101 RepID=A0ABQ9IAH3_9NEOP|nr:hypothetical protein PR048_006252 [Dryococelus australis]
MDNDIEAVAKSCSDCELEKPNPEKCELWNWPLPTGPWQRIHEDFLGSWEGKMHLIVVDAFSTVGVSDNDPRFTAVEFQKCLAANRVQSILTPTYHPQSNGQAENSAQVYKHKLRTMVRSGASIPQAITIFVGHFKLSTLYYGRDSCQADFW